MINCIAIDDEPLALELLEDNIRHVPFLKLAASYNNAIDALKGIRELHVDLVFLDIQMPGLTGLQFIKSLMIKPMFILVTAYEKFAIEGFNHNVVDYLVKPVSIDRFIQASHKALELYEWKHGINAGDVKTESDYFFINADYSLVKVMYNNIIWIEGSKDYIKIHLKDGQTIITRHGMKSIEDELPASQFLRIHKSYIISKYFITSVKKSSIVLENKMELPVGENYKGRIDELVNKKK